MKTKKASQATEVNLNDKQLEIFEKIIGFNWASIALDIKKTLNLLALTYIRSERIEGECEETRANIAFHLWALQNLINDLRDCELNWPNLDDKKLFFDDRITGFSTEWNDPETASNAKDTLSELALDYIKSEEVTGEPKEDRDKISFHFHLLNNLLSDIYDLSMIAEEIERTNSGSEKSVKTQPFGYHCNDCAIKEEEIKKLQKINKELIIDLKASLMEEGKSKYYEDRCNRQERRIEELISGSKTDCKLVIMEKEKI
jgi:hypothetical protein